MGSTICSCYLFLFKSASTKQHRQFYQFDVAVEEASVSWGKLWALKMNAPFDRKPNVRRKDPFMIQIELAAHFYKNNCITKGFVTAVHFPTL